MIRVDQWLNHLQGLLWPPTCILCGGAGQPPTLDLCAHCEADLPANGPACCVCAQPLAGDSAVLTCGACLRRPPGFDASCCPFLYAYPIDHLVRALKFRGGVVPGRVLGELLARYISRQQRDSMPEILLPAPLSLSRYRQRGYNQAVEIGQRLVRRLSIPMRTDMVTRVRDTREQASLNRRERRKNIRRAFAILTPPPDHVAIVDDVVTTGSTANELARVLKRAGAKYVEVWGVARTT